MLLQRGTRIGSYEVVALIGTGGMGEVYRTALGGYARANYDVFPDGSFLMLKPVEQRGPLTQINVVLGWSEEVKRLAPSSSR